MSKIEQALAELKDVTDRLKRSTSRQIEQIQEMETRLRELGGGVSAWIDVPVQAGQIKLGWIKVDRGIWGLYLKRGVRAYGTGGQTAYSDPLSLIDMKVTEDERSAAIAHFAPLLHAIAVEAEALIAKITAVTSP